MPSAKIDRDSCLRYLRDNRNTEVVQVVLRMLDAEIQELSLKLEQADERNFQKVQGSISLCRAFKSGIDGQQPTERQKSGAYTA